jgi:hypothetical protein
MEGLTKKIQAQFDKMCATGKLFRVALSGSNVWDTYLGSFENDAVFRSPDSSYHNCNNCNNFLRRYGNIVAIDGTFNLMSIFDVELEDGSEYSKPMANLSNLIKSTPITEVFVETFDSLKELPYEVCKKSQAKFRLGIAANTKHYSQAEAEMYGVVKAGEIRTFKHLHLDLPTQFVDKTGKSIEAIQAAYRDAKNVFKRGLDEISIDTLQLVKELIQQGSMLDGQTHLHKVQAFLNYARVYSTIESAKKDLWCWDQSYGLNIAKFRNELIGTLCTELSEGKDLNEAVKAWNIRVDPANYHKAKPVITESQKARVSQFVEDNGYTESFDRRFADLKDIKVSEILHSNVGHAKIKTVNLFDGIKTTSTRHKRAEFDNIETVSIEKFMAEILPNCTSVEAYLQNNHEGNLVSLTTANNADSKKIFKWDNNFSWTYNGNLAGKSQIKQAVKSAGGKVDGVLRFSISWNEDGKSIVDFDAHAVEPDRTEIYYGSFKGRKTRMTGMLDVDMISPRHQGVENITWVDKSKMVDGKYSFFNRNFNGGSNTGFRAEVEFEGESFTYEFKGNAKADVKVATVTLKNGQFTIEHHLPVIDSVSKDLYGLPTNAFHKVNLICLSPNHWEGQVGNKHYFFMLQGAKSPNSIRSFHNENLRPELLDFKREMEILGLTRQIESTDGQLSGLGFNATIPEQLIVKLTGSFKRVVKIQF